MKSFAAVAKEEKQGDYLLYGLVHILFSTVWLWLLCTTLLEGAVWLVELIQLNLIFSKF